MDVFEALSARDIAEAIDSEYVEASSSMMVEGVALQAVQKRRDPVGRRIRGLIRSNGTKR